MQNPNHSANANVQGWCHQAQAFGVVVVRPVSVSVVLMDSITRTADAKRAPSGRNRGVP